MFPCRQKVFRAWHRTVLRFSVVLLLAWSFASIFHQLDLTPEHHTHHHCQLFAGAQQALAKSQATLHKPCGTRSHFCDVTERSYHIEEVPSAARAPPYFA